MPDSVPVGGPPFHVMTKPIGPLCNLGCQYCFYLEKEKLFPGNENFKMRDEVLEAFIQQYITQQNVPEVSFAWQGGEPTLLGVSFFRKVVELQKKHANGKKISNAFQTNGTLLDDTWGAFFSENQFLVGISVDGPPKLHNTYRVDKKGMPTYDQVIRGVKCLKKHGVEFNTLTVVNRRNAQKPLDVYRFLKEIGSGFIQFIPLVERLPDAEARSLGLDLATPPQGHEQGQARLLVTESSVEPRQYGDFLITIFEEWVRGDVGKVFVQLFDAALGNWIGAGSSLCVFAEKCGSALALEHNGEVYSCDHYVYPQYKLGNLLNRSLAEMLDSPQQRKFGSDKLDALPGYCRKCDVRFACNGECPKHRFLSTPDGEYGLNYLCAGYKRFFNHIGPSMHVMKELLQRGRAPAEVMHLNPLSTPWCIPT